MHLASDNTAGIAPEIMQAMAAANTGFMLGYGNDEITRKVERQIADLFGRECAVFLVPTGTAANALSLAHITPPWGGVICHQQAHIVTDECGAPEFFGAGMKLLTVPGDDGKLTVAGVDTAIERYSGKRPHQVNAASLSITNATESGTIYRVGEVAALSARAHAHGLKVHMDGARFGNALVRLNANPAELSWKAGVDVLSFGATKGGALAAEAVVFFDPAIADTMHERRKRGGQLLSKHRFIAAQFEGFLANDCWLRLARHANDMADLLASGLTNAGFKPVWPVDANLVFVVIPAALDKKLRAAGAQYNARRKDRLPDGAIGEDQLLVRLVTSFQTMPKDVETFLHLVQNR